MRFEKVGCELVNFMMRRFQIHLRFNLGSMVPAGGGMRAFVRSHGFNYHGGATHAGETDRGKGG